MAGVVLSPATIALITSILVLTGVGGYYISKRLTAPPSEESGVLTGKFGDAYGSLEGVRTEA